ncbi:AraC family transcriptional regulator [Paenibacillus sp. CAA11]|uniref:AraC family transcriptional regulator n=1 Tax=Paenibacillus sp. CAA11 TaxID=1532905 RepID=UPI000D36ABFE|nr:AraC family transcriptional regulator [Paenibacillus sp. CAA11]AWB45598.1 AraC family transcriptional regulator [Paenibacillus sp. CAA11]
MSFIKVNVDWPIPFTSAGEFLSEAAWSHADRVMDSYELILGVNGIVYIQEEENKYEVGPGDLLLLSPGRRHAGYQASTPGVSFYWFHFDLPEEFTVLTQEEMKREAALIHKALPRSCSIRHLYIPKFMHLGANDRISVLINQILHIANSNYLTYHSVNYPFTSLLIEISEQILSSYSLRGGGAKGDIQFAKILEWTRIHAAEPLTVSEIACRFSYNKDYLTRLFKQHTSKNPLEYIHSVRIGKAKELLSRTTLTIKEIAAEVGFSDEKYFMRLFRRYENMTPKQFRNAYHRTFMNND